MACSRVNFTFTFYPSLTALGAISNKFCEKDWEHLTKVLKTNKFHNTGTLILGTAMLFNASHKF